MSTSPPDDAEASALADVEVMRTTLRRLGRTVAESVEMLRASESRSTALAQVLASAGFEVCQGRWPSDAPGTPTADGTTVAASLGANTWTTLLVSAEQDESWRTLHSPRAGSHDDYLTGVTAQGLRSMAISATALPDFLGQPPQLTWDGDIVYALRYDLALSLWWHARLGEGHTEDSALFLLTLTAHPVLLPLVVYNPGGVPSVGATHIVRCTPAVATASSHF